LDPHRDNPRNGLHRANAGHTAHHKPGDASSRFQDLRECITEFIGEKSIYRFRRRRQTRKIEGRAADECAFCSLAPPGVMLRFANSNRIKTVNRIGIADLDCGLRIADCGLHCREAATLLLSVGSPPAALGGGNLELICFSGGFAVLPLQARLLRRLSIALTGRFLHPKSYLSAASFQIAAYSMALISKL